MTQIAASTSLYGLGTAKKADQFVGAAAKSVARPRVRWYE
jgi:hypothetical protein